MTLPTLNNFLFVQPSWEVELDALLSSTFGAAGPSVALAEPVATTVESTTLAKLRELLPLLASNILECKGLDSMR